MRSNVMLIGVCYIPTGFTLIFMFKWTAAWRHYTSATVIGSLFTCSQYKTYKQWKHTLIHLIFVILVLQIYIALLMFLKGGNNIN